MPNVYRERCLNQQARVFAACMVAMGEGRMWSTLREIEADCGGYPAAGAVMALRNQGKLQIRINGGRVEIAPQL